ncbi:MAG: YigZ family protein [Candidatus Neomarinimicrobiota bacterium]|nr:MAG: YigZ family protein [Candidatus Neomarinimicrobiota bacterium]
MLFDDSYKTIVNHSEGFFKDRGSKFISHAYPVKTEEDVKEILAQLRKDYYDARHHCYAYILNPDKSAFRINDDGEPSGSAGKPIHGQLLSYDLTNTLVVVIRYFGGTKLGIPGLINAYREATRDALNQTEIITKTINEYFQIEYEYPLMGNVMRIIKDENLEQINTQFEISCKIEMRVRKNDYQRIADEFGKIHGVKLVHLRTK